MLCVLKNVYDQDFQFSLCIMNCCPGVTARGLFQWPEAASNGAQIKKYFCTVAVSLLSLVKVRYLNHAGTIIIKRCRLKLMKAKEILISLEGKALQNQAQNLLGLNLVLNYAPRFKL